MIDIAQRREKQKGLSSLFSQRPPPPPHSPRSAQAPGHFAPFPSSNPSLSSWIPFERPPLRKLLLLLKLLLLKLLLLKLLLLLLPLKLLLLRRRRTLHPSRQLEASASAKSSSTSGATPKENWQLKSSRFGLIRSGRPMSSAKNRCVGSLHELRQAETQPVEAR